MCWGVGVTVSPQMETRGKLEWVAIVYFLKGAARDASQLQSCNAC